MIIYCNIIQVEASNNNLRLPAMGNNSFLCLLLLNCANKKNYKTINFTLSGLKLKTTGGELLKGLIEGSSI